MNKELIALIATVAGLTILGLSAILAVAICRPTTDIQQFATTVATFLGPVILIFVQTFKIIQNGAATNRVEVKVDGNLQAALDNAGLVGGLHQQIVAAKEAAVLAAKTAADTAKALAIKKEVL